MEIVVKDTYGKFSNRKYLLKKVTLGGLNEQSGGEYSSSYLNLTCYEATLDGVALPR